MIISSLPVQAPASTGSPSGNTPSPAKPEETLSENPRRETARPENTQGLEEAQLQELADLKARDREVRAHETAHQAVGGQYTGAISYVFKRGPDGNQYAVGGEVPIDTAPIEGDPQATIEKMRVVQAAALAPAEPSAQDRAVAAKAMQLMLQAQSELALERRETRETTDSQSRGAAGVYDRIAGMTETDDTDAAPQPAFKATA
ncbi:MAG: putative metalloprotease CJM1_0395 family protein [Oleiphilaceae bacterium]|nr:putative metalloprotease CJM1_0395 family protein [Oleiphilaceae bacterium]